MPRKEKVYVRPMEDAMQGSAIPTQMLVENRRAYGGAICHICRHHIDVIEDSDDDDEMRGGGYLSKAAEKVEKTARKGASKLKKAGREVDKYVTTTDGLLSDVVNYGIPAASAATLSALATPLGPGAQIAASALGSKLGTMASDKIAKETMIQSRTGEGLKPKRKGRFEKGSEAAKEHMRMIREKKVKKMLE